MQSALEEAALLVVDVLPEEVVPLENCVSLPGPAQWKLELRSQ